MSGVSRWTAVPTHHTNTGPRARSDPMPAAKYRLHESRRSFSAFRITPEKRHEPIARARLPARDLLAYSSLHHLLGLTRISKEGVGSPLGDASPLPPTDPALLGRHHGASP